MYRGYPFPTATEHHHGRRPLPKTPRRTHPNSSSCRSLKSAANSCPLPPSVPSPGELNVGRLSYGLLDPALCTLILTHLGFQEQGTCRLPWPPPPNALRGLFSTMAWDIKQLNDLPMASTENATYLGMQTTGCIRFHMPWTSGPPPAPLTGDLEATLAMSIELCRKMM